MKIKSILITSIFFVFAGTIIYFISCIHKTTLEPTYKLVSFEKDYKLLCKREFSLDVRSDINDNLINIYFKSKSIYDESGFQYDESFLNKLNIVQKVLVRVMSSIDKRPEFYLITGESDTENDNFYFLGKISDMVKYLDGYLSRSEYSTRKIVLQEKPSEVSELFFIEQFIVYKIKGIFNKLTQYFSVNKVELKISDDTLELKYDIVEKRKVQKNLVLNKMSEIINDTLIDKYPYNKITKVIYYDVFHERKVTLPFINDDQQNGS